MCWSRPTRQRRFIRTAAAEFQVHATVLAVARQHRIGAQQRGRALAVGLDAGVRQACILGQVHVAQRIDEMGVAVDGQVVLDHRQRRTGAQFDQVAQVPGAVRAIGGPDEDQMQRLVAAYARLGAQQHAFSRKSRVEAREHFVRTLEAALQEACRIAALSQARTTVAG